MNEVWRRVYCFDSGRCRIRVAEITNRIYEDACSNQQLLQDAIGGTEWNGNITHELPMQEDYDDDSLFMPKALRVYPDKFVIGHWGPEGWARDIIPEWEQEFYENHDTEAWFSRQLVDIYVEGYYKEINPSIEDALHQDDRDDFRAFVEYIQSEQESN